MRPVTFSRGFKAAIAFACLLVGVSHVAFGQEVTGYSQSQPYYPRRDARDKTAKIRPNGYKLVRPEFVTIPVSVSTSDGRAVLGLERDHFRVALGTTRAEVISVVRPTEPIHIGILINASGSAGLIADKARSVAKHIIDTLRPEDKATVATVTSKLDILARATSDRAMLDKAIKSSVKSPGWQGTALYDALERMVVGVTGDEPLTALVMITDGVDSASKRVNLVTALEAVERSRVRVFNVYFDSESWGGRLQVRDLQRSRALNDLSRDILEARAKDAAARGRDFLADLIATSGGRSISLSDIAAGQIAGLESLTNSLLNPYYIKVKVPQDTQEDRLPVTVQVLRSDLTVLARGSLVF